MRIAFLTFEYPDVRPGGVGSYVHKCALSVAAAGHEAHIFTLTVPQHSRRPLPPGVFLHDVHDIAEQIADGTLPGPLGVTALNGELATYKLTVGVLLCHALRRQHHETPFDIIEAAEYEALALPLMLQPLDNVPIITQIHLGTGVNSYGNGLAIAKTDELANALELASILAADAVYAATRSIVDVTRRILSFERDVAIIPYPVAPVATPTSPPGDGPVLFVGRLQKRKGCEIFASALPPFLKRHKTAIVHIAGADTNTGPNATSMQQEMLRRIDPSLQHRVRFLGELTQSQVTEEIQKCRFQVIPSVVENFANTAIDALVAGRMVIYAGDTGLDDVIGDAGLRVWPLTPENLAKEMDHAWTAPSLPEHYARKGLDRVRKEFAINEVTTRRLDFYRAVQRGYNRQARQSIYDRFGEMKSVHMGCVLNALTTLLHATVGVPFARTTPGRQVKSRLDDLAHRLGRSPVVWLFGAGRYTLRLLAEKFLWESQGLSIAGVIDEHPRFAGIDTYLGLRLRSLTDMHAALAAGETVDAVLLSTDTLQEVFWERTATLRARGIETIRLV